jgi:hypothetical protein
MPAVEVEVVKLAGHAHLETITDREGFVWCIDGMGRNAALLIAPRNLKGPYNWASSRALGQHVDLDLPASIYSNIKDGPQYCEIYLYLQARLESGFVPTPTVVTPIEALLFGPARHGGTMSTRKTVVTAMEK